jgi:hypothetical protein
MSLTKEKQEMRPNEYDPAEAVDIGKAEDIILGRKDWPEVGDVSTNPPYDRMYIDECK